MQRSTKLKISLAKGMINAQSTISISVNQFIRSQQQAIYSFITEIADEISGQDPEDITAEDEDVVDALQEAANEVISVDAQYSPDDFEAAMSTTSDLLADARSWHSERLSI